MTEKENILGGYQQRYVAQKHKDLLVQHHQDINNMLGISATEFQIQAVRRQVVDGKNYQMHLVCNNGDKYTVIINKPIEAPTNVLLAQKGHL